jgi:hypothetical protein
VATFAFGNAIADFRNTLEIARIELLDPSGNSLRDVALTDLKGNVLGAAPAIPEPGTLGLIGLGLAGIGLAREISRRTRKVAGSRRN